MIIQCEECQTKFNIDETLLRNEGSKVRCSLCKHIFVAYPPEQTGLEEPLPFSVGQEELEVQEESIEVGLDDEFDFDGKIEAPREDIEEVGHDRETGESLEDIEEEFEGELFEQGEITAALSEPKRSGSSYALFFFLAVVLVLIAGSAAVIFWAPDLIPDSLSILKPAEKQEVTDMGNVHLSFKPTLGFYINSEKAGQLFVIQGIVENGYPMSRSFILVKGILWDDKGQMVKEKLAYGGNSINREDLAVMSLEEINKAMKNREGTGRKNVNIAPGASVPFTIVFENLPENVSQYGGEVVSSSIGSP